MLKVGSLFAGMGGICQAFQDAGCQISWSNEIDRNACKTYRLNFSHPLYEEDIRSLDPKALPKVDVLTGGFPCQAFSIAGHRKGFKDERGTLFFDMLRFIDEHHPKALFLENVRYLKTHDDGNTFKQISKELESRGYTIKEDILNTCEYSTLPQNRERIYIVCFKSKAAAQRFGFPEKKSGPLINLKKLLEKEASDIHYFKNYPHYYKIAVQQLDDPDAIYQWRRVYLRKNKRGVCPTLTANMGCGGHNVPLIRDSKDIRRMTPRECMRFQGFPETFKIPEDVALGSIYKQIGNSVSIPVVKDIALKIKTALLSD